MYTLETMFPKGSFFTTALTNVAQEIAPNLQAVYVTGGVVVGGAAIEVVRFQSQDAATIYFDVLVPINAVIPLWSFRAERGLEVVTTSVAGDVGVALAYVTV